MRIHHLAAVAALVVAPTALAAQGAAATLQTRTYILHHLWSNQVVQLIGPYVDAEGGGVYAPESIGHAITVRGTARNLASVDSVLRIIDVPKATPTVVLRFELIEPANQPSDEAGLQDVQSALRRTLGISGARLIARGAVSAQAGADFAVTMSGDDGRFLVSGSLHDWNDESAATVSLEVGLMAADMAPRDSASVATNMMRAIMPGNKIVETTITAPLGRTVVLGSGTREATGDTVILVVTPTLLQ